MTPTQASFGPFTGWRVRLDAQRAVPTPAVSDGRLLVGGGFGSHDFYGFDAATGRPAWHLKTKDDGPTAAVVMNGWAVFNTESCTLEVVSIADGRVVAESWLGDPLLAQPAVSANRVFMAFPANDEHVLGAFELPGLKPLWRTPITHDVITAPVCAEGKVWFATFDGWVWCLNERTGAVEWARDMGATSAPWIDNGRAFVSTRAKRCEHGRQAERVTRLSRSGAVDHEYAAKMARHLDRKWGAARKAGYHKDDASVGFGNAPAAAKLNIADAHLGEGLVSRTWRYQGSRPVVWHDLLFETIDDRLEARDIDTDAVVWSWDGATGIEGERRLTPPAVANGRVWCGTWDGFVRSWDARTGQQLWEAPVGAPCHWQPVVAGGWVYAGLEDGSLVGINTADPANDGWPMWGGGAGHNGQAVSETAPASTQ
jgi:Ca-activated chloride channel family protein